jgi:hypothetical protein
MSIEQRIKYHKYLLVSKCLKNEAPVYLTEYVKVFLKSSVFAFGICNFSLTTFRREKGFLSDKYWILFFKYTGASFFRHFETRRYL